MRGGPGDGFRPPALPEGGAAPEIEACPGAERARPTATKGVFRMANGNLTFDSNGMGRGVYSNLSIKLRLVLEPTDNDSARKEMPSHNVYAETAHGPILIGAAWRKTGERGELTGKSFFSISIDDPSFDAPLNVTAFPTEKVGEYEIVWRRARGAAAQAA